LLFSWIGESEIRYSSKSTVGTRIYVPFLSKTLSFHSKPEYPL
jgi:hypothetical protein